MAVSTSVETPFLSDQIVDGAVDYKSRPAIRSKSGRWKSASFIIAVEMAERFAYFGISSNLITYLTGPLAQSTATAAANVNAWFGAVSLLPLVGAFISDSFLGHYRTIVVASLLYILGLGLLTLSAFLSSFYSTGYQITENVIVCSPSEFQIIFFFFALYLVAVAQGGYMPCLVAFGANQFDGHHPGESKDKSSFFNWWYFGICIGATLTLMISTYIQDNLSWVLGFGIPCILMVFALILFLLGTVTYRFHINGADTRPFRRISRVFVRAVRNWRTTSSVVNMGEDSQVLLPYQGSEQFKFLNKALLRPGGLNEDGEVCSMSEVEEAKTVLRLLPIWATCLVYAMVFSQSATLFTKQGVTLDRSISSSFEIPPASLQSFISVTIVLFIPIYDRILVPVARAITGKPSGITTLQRIGTGLFLSFLAMVVAAVVERKRLETARACGLVDNPKATIPMSIKWLIPQYVLFGIHESLTSVGLQELFYDQAPTELKSVGLALYVSIFGIGSFLCNFLISLIENATGGEGRYSWFSDNLNRAHLDYFYWLLAGLSAAAFTAFVYLAKSWFRHQQTND